MATGLPPPPPPPDQPDEVLTLDGVAKLLKLGGRKTAHAAFKAGEIPDPRFWIGGRPRWLMSDLAEWVRRGGTGPPDGGKSGKKVEEPAQPVQKREAPKRGD